MLLPFLPGRYDSVAVPLSMMAQLFGIVGLLLVPLGLAWIAYEYGSEAKQKRRVFAIVALVTSFLAWCVVSLSVMFESIALGVGALGIGAFVTLWLWPQVRKMSTQPVEGRVAVVNHSPLYLILVPATVAIVRVAVADPAVEFSRSRAIRNAADLIADIEHYRVANGRYPPSLVSVHPDYLPGVVGIREYRYEPTGDAYNVLFEQLTLRIGIKEIVMYNPRGEQAISSHAWDVLQLSPEQLALDRTRGHNAVHVASQPSWKFFWFD